MKYFPARVKSFQSEKIECYLEFLLVIQYRTEKTSLISDKCGVFKCFSQNTLLEMLRQLSESALMSPVSQYSILKLTVSIGLNKAFRMVTSIP